MRYNSKFFELKTKNKNEELLKNCSFYNISFDILFEIKSE